MKIAYIGKVSLSALAGCGRWERQTASGGWVADESGLSRQKWGFNLGSMIIKGLLRREHEVHVVSAEPEDVCGRFRCHVDGEDRCRLTVAFVPESRKTRWMYLRFFWREMAGMRRTIREVKPDVCFAQWTYENAYAGLTSGYPTLVVAHDSPWRIAFIERNLQTLIKAFYAQFAVFPRIKHLTTVSPYIVDDVRRYNRYKGEINVVPNGIGTVCETCTIRHNATTIICVSQSGRRKNASALLTAWKIIKEKHPDWRLKVFGQGMPDGQISREEIDRILHEEADLFVSPSLEESFGMVFVEAMRLGVPCIGGEKSGAVPWVLGCEGMRDEGWGMRDEIGGMRDDREGMAGGVVCDVTRPEKLAECIEKVMGDEELRKRLSEGGIRRVKEMFDIEKVVDLYERELERVRGEGWGMRDEV